MEQLLHYVWKHRLFPLTTLTTTGGLSVEVIDPGLHNRDAGPDFFNAKVRVDGTLWVGNVELHDRASDWFRHGHDRDPRYDNVVLHVVGEADQQALTAQGKTLPQLVLPVPEKVSLHYRQLLAEDRYPPCHRLIPTLPRLTVHSWMSALQTERLEQKTEAIGQRLQRANGSWEDAFFATLARNYGFGINGDAFETWAGHLPLHQAGHHRDNLFQIEALFLGQAGLLQPEALPTRQQEAALADDYYQRMAAEYRYLAHKFALQPMDYRQWRFLRLRPQNFPHIRLSQLANLYCSRRASLSQLTDCRDTDQLKACLQTQATPYWQDHYAFGQPSKHSDKRLSEASLQLLIINTAVPVLFAYGRYKHNDALCDRAFELLEGLPTERNHIVTLWRQCGLPVGSAADSQALIQLKRMYCDRKDCLRCRIGYEYLKQK